MTERGVSEYDGGTGRAVRTTGSAVMRMERKKMEANIPSGERKRKNRPYLLYLRQTLIALKPHYEVFRDGMNAVYTVEGDLARRVFSIRRGGSEILTLRRKLARILAEYTIEKDGQVIARVKKGLFRSLSGQVYDKERIYERVWGYDAEGDSAVVAEHIRRIRAKLGRYGEEGHIETVWGMGYKWVK